MDDAQLARLGTHMMSSKEEGLGIGIYITKATLEQLGGDIKWKNRKPKGMRVSISLPLRA